MCHKCSTPWSDGNFALSVIPAVQRDRKAKKLIDLLVAGKYLKKIQKSLALKYKEDVNNRAVSGLKIIILRSILSQKLPFLSSLHIIYVLD